jgi:cytochrome c
VTGKELYNTYCSACHSLSPPPKAAPPFRGIIRRYYELHQKEEKFIRAIEQFVLEPQKSTVVCAPAKERFGEMPKLPLQPTQVKKIAKWMWEDKSLWPMMYR